MIIKTNSVKTPSESPTLKPNISLVESLLIFLILFGLGYIVYSLISQIYLLNIELKTLVSLVQSLQENQIDLKNQLLLKDQQVTLLENNLNNLNSATISSLSESPNLEFLKKELIKNNSEMTNFYIKTSFVIFSFVLISKCIKSLL